MTELMQGLPAILWPLAAIIGSLCLAGIIKKGGIKGLSLSREGGLKLETAVSALRSRGSVKYLQDRQVTEVDERLRAKENAIVGKLLARIEKAILLSDDASCRNAAAYLAIEIRRILYEAVADNDMKNNLTLANRPEYLARKLASLKEQYEARPVKCPKDGQENLKPWEAAEPELVSILSDWADDLASAVRDASKEKIDIYQVFRPSYEEAGDTDFLSIVDALIERNQGYITALAPARGEVPA